MGCGASAKSHPPSEPAPKTAEPAVVTWATKTSHADVVAFNGQSANGSKGASKSTNEQNCILLDAEDNDEIEIIYEVQPKRQNQIRPAAANGQEAPEAAEFLDALPNAMQPKPLSKQQQEEAAKLAERRKRFDNQRYQREQREGPQTDSPSQISNPGPIFSKPNTDMILGLSLTDIGPKDQDPHGGFLPGGILDDTEEIQPKPNVAKKNKHMHDDIRSSGFDADDERLMKEILENCEDV